MSTETTTRELNIHPRLQSLLPPLPPEVFEGLEASILKHGCLSPLIIWNDTIVDGHWRYAICKKHDLPFMTINKEFESVEDAMIWMFEHQCGQRNLDESLEDEVQEQEPVDDHESEFDVLKIDPNLIRTDLGTQVRIALDKEAVDDYASAMRRGDDFPAILVFYDKENDRYILVDGFHRLSAHKMARPGEPIRVRRRFGNLESALWAAIGANKRNSVRRTNEDKRQAVEWALIHACGVKMSNRQIAGHVGVDEITVRRARTRLESTATLSQSPERVGRDGRTINTSNIGKRATENEASSKISLKKLLDNLDHDNAETFFAGAIDLFRRHDKIDQGTAERMLCLLTNPGNG